MPARDICEKNHVVGLLDTRITDHMRVRHKKDMAFAERLGGGNNALFVRKQGLIRGMGGGTEAYPACYGRSLRPAAYKGSLVVVGAVWAGVSTLSIMAMSPASGSFGSSGRAGDCTKYTRVPPFCVQFRSDWTSFKEGSRSLSNFSTTTAARSARSGKSRARQDAALCREPCRTAHTALSCRRDGHYTC